MALFPFDPIGNLSSNLIVNEQHSVLTVNGVDHNYIVPRNAPFFNESMVVVNKTTGDILNRGTDWEFGWDFEAGLDEVGKSLSGCIYFIDKNLTGNYSLLYQTLGGDFVTATTQAIANGLETLTNLQTFTWDQVAPETIPTEWPATPHNQPMTDVESVTHIINAIDRVADILSTAPPYIHLNDIIDLDHEYFKPLIASMDDIAQAIRDKQDSGIYHDKFMLPQSPARTITGITANTWKDVGLVGTVMKAGTYKLDVDTRFSVSGYETRFLVSSNGGTTYSEIPESYAKSTIVGLSDTWLIKLQVRYTSNQASVIVSDTTANNRRHAIISLVRLGM